MKKIILTVLLSIGTLFAAPFNSSGKASDITVKIQSDKDLFVGQNNVTISLTKEGKPLTPKSVELKAFMPEMPGMPEMSEEGETKGKNGIYKGSLNFSMNGTWQVTVTIIDTDGKRKRFKTSVSL
ncbi:MAG: FixH family protein [Sulfuricurvum sp.]|nr:FixH family protein [Sulfuricurvum sp.]